MFNSLQMWNIDKKHISCLNSSAKFRTNLLPEGRQVVLYDTEIIARAASAATAAAMWWAEQMYEVAHRGHAGPPKDPEPFVVFGESLQSAIRESLVNKSLVISTYVQYDSTILGCALDAKLDLGHQPWPIEIEMTITRTSVMLKRGGRDPRPIWPAELVQETG